ncbi:DNA-directed RNA polymerase III subunit [Wickerhamomyces ciferrii]|uniref:DNA-directed RNA polymerase III subunit n=1 Tax=Wickerhamomyces ciferrii (strain ATCC 14091 / BCRC 22168 / CBS 111 / JCM 3599 / NBRC 0793 / NRRL Y-1031 F-60-10) TaxID=1206466 RepID=K0KC89_WICCF|nr:DNA-directed RNA polymerase III subunit [Wickerhamomyces ciferrii]CCH42695.1 DNA-directed RNA polymerase III subunit [Wickerhamomyces ciferrii]
MSNKLFVKEDEDDEVGPSPSITSSSHSYSTYFNNEEDSQDLDDPIIKEIPVILKQPNPDQRILLLQYPGRPTTRPFINENRVWESREKINTDVIEVDVPIDTTRFYDSTKNDNWGIVEKQTLRGVMNESDGYYAASVQDGELILIPVKKVSQMRPAFNYIDKEAADKKELNRLENNGNGNNHNNSGVQVVQMSVKGSADNAPRLGGALLARKNADEEEFVQVPWSDVNDEETVEVRNKVLTVYNKSELASNTTNDDYINMLVHDTIVE